MRTGGRAGVRVLSLRHHTASRLNILHTPSDQLQSPGTASRDADGISRQNRAQAEMHHTMYHSLGGPSMKRRTFKIFVVILNRHSACGSRENRITSTTISI